MLMKLFNMNEKDKEEFIEITGKTILYITERRSLADMAKRLKLEPWQVDYNIDEILYQFRKSLGWRRYIKVLFFK